MNQVSCASLRFCVAGGDYTDGLGSHGFESVFNGSTWTDHLVAAKLNPGTPTSLNSVSCMPGASCVAGGFYTVDPAGHELGYLSVTDGVSWTDSPLPLSAPPADGVPTNVSSVSCTQKFFCTAVGGYSSNGSQEYAFASTYQGAAPAKRTITCVKGKITKKVTAVNPVCPAGYKKK